MKKKAPELSRNYLAALRTHVRARKPGGAKVARGFGRELAASGFDTLDLARMHEQALREIAVAPDLPTARNQMIRRAGHFFTEALVPLERAHRATRESVKQLEQRTETLRRHTAALADANRQLKHEVARRRASEAAGQRGKARYQLLFSKSQFMEKKLRHLARQILSAQEAERREISRELHDEVVQTLVGISVELAALGKGAFLGIRSLREKIARTQRLVGKSVNAVHRFARELRPAVLDDLGLIPGLHALMKAVAARQKFKIRLTAFAGIETLDPTKRTVLYRVAQEALTNVVRHADARLVDVNISEKPGMVCMEVHDDGKSFSVSQTLSSTTNKRLGLLGMRERVEMVGGVLTIESERGHGTTLRVEIPFRQGGAR